MPNNNSVAVATLQCPVCGTIHSHNAPILFHRRLGNIDPKKTFAGRGLCEEHQKQQDDDYVFLVVISNPDDAEVETLNEKNAMRTGKIISIKKEVFLDVFNVPLPPEGMVFTSKEVADDLEKYIN